MSLWDEKSKKAWSFVLDFNDDIPISLRERNTAGFHEMTSRIPDGQCFTGLPYG